MSGNGSPPWFDDHTVIRPNPGGRRPAAVVPEPAAPVPPPMSAARGGPIDDFGAFAGQGLNPLVKAAAALLLLAAGLRRSREHGDVAGLHERVVREVKAFERQAVESNVGPESVMAARYGLCTYIDEAVMNTPWGGHSLWASRPLLLTFHNDTAGGEKFFQMVERVLADREPRCELIEFFYVCLALGFEGKFRISDSGRKALAETRERLYARIRTWREETNRELSPSWRGLEDRRHRLVRGLPAWVFVTIAATVSIAAFLTFHTLLNTAAAPILGELNAVKQATFESPSRTAPVVGPSLVELLKGADPDRLLVESMEAGGTRLTLTGGAFASGRTTLSDAYLPVIDRIAKALDRIGGRVLVIGHTDDVPIHSLAIKDNYELSWLRARNTAGRLRKSLTVPDLVSYIGVGADRPRYRPVDTAQNRARNRRIEMIYLPGAGQ
ncbi:MAG: type IVB secretion system protein IcmH/DotU [Nitrococcus sp.]|nr:type IVB secretion system protein IcmH/DotU [Nitrococcus sp.]